MKLQLIHAATPQGQMRACILGGADASDWLSQMKTWNISLSNLECYCLPTSLQNRQVSALMVVFQGSSSEWPTDLHFPLRLEGERLLLPQNAQLQPRLLPEELKQFSNWQYALLHPKLGLIGFEVHDRVDFLQVILPPLPSGNIWDQAIASNTKVTQLASIQLEPPKMDEVWEEIKGEVGSKPLEEIPKDGQTEGGSGGFFGSLLGGLGDIAEGIKGILPQGNPGEEQGIVSGALDKFKQWTDKMQQEMQAKAQTEMERLMKLFEENPEEAIKFAPPINSESFSRASGNPNFSLGVNDFKYEPNRFRSGSGGSWNIGDDLHRLLWQRYNDAAKAAIDAGDYEKAAYIYAHLLKNYQQAAEALVLARRYREAAMLYAEKVKLPLKAAECHEWAGDYLKAAEIYVDHKKWERAGDMFLLAGNQKQAHFYFDRQILDYKDTQHFLEAANLAEEKLKDPKRRQDILLEGWKTTSQSQLLSLYFQEILNDAELEKGQFIAEFFQDHVSPRAQAAFVNTLAAQLDLWKEAGAAKAIRSLAYQIGKAGANANSRNQMALMARLIPEDGLINQEITWFFFPSNQKEDNRQTPLLQLDPEFKWLGTCATPDFDLAWGLNGKTLKFARISGLIKQEAIHPEDIQEWNVCLLLPPIMEDDPAFLFQDTASTPVNAHFPRQEGFPKELFVGSNHYLFAEDRRISAGMTQNGNLFQILYANETLLLAYTYDELSDLSIAIRLPFSSTPGKFSEAYAMYADIIAFHDKHKVHWFFNQEDSDQGGTLFHFSGEIQASTGLRQNLQHPILAFASSDKLILVKMSNQVAMPEVIENHFLDQAFGVGEVKAMRFLSDSQLLILRREELRLISIRGESVSSKITRITFGSEVVGILKSDHTSKFKLLLSTGAVLEA